MLSEKKHPQVKLRPASYDDIELVYTWQCHPNTRKYALNPKVPTWEEHKQWMNEKLSNDIDYFYIIVDSAGHALGVVRLDHIKNSDFLVSIFISPDNYGQGIATMALKNVDSQHPELTLHATILESNQSSQHLFIKMGYLKVANEKYVRSPLKKAP
ncbi:GNAT family N-acetyltransferase [Vibrio cyclitrophicus]|nr:GNAT family N-acetyltransferase [Vibrio cyclitrophicus]UPR52333.1 GNAT family N-acetyltransferase [Vibrio cyclitrophicus]